MLAGSASDWLISICLPRFLRPHGSVRRGLGVRPPIGAVSVGVCHHSSLRLFSPHAGHRRTVTATRKKRAERNDRLVAERPTFSAPAFVAFELKPRGLHSAQKAANTRSPTKARNPWNRAIALVVAHVCL